MASRGPKGRTLQGHRYTCRPSPRPKTRRVASPATRDGSDHEKVEIEALMHAHRTRPPIQNAHPPAVLHHSQGTKAAPFISFPNARGQVPTHQEAPPDTQHIGKRNAETLQPPCIPPSKQYHTRKSINMAYITGHHWAHLTKNGLPPWKSVLPRPANLGRVPSFTHGPARARSYRSLSAHNSNRSA